MAQQSTADRADLPPKRVSTWTYDQTLKDADVEERINYRFHRPLAFQVIRPFEHWKSHPSPNQITLVAGAIGMGAGVVAGLSAWYGSYLLTVSGLMLFVSVVLDCCDGMLARITGQTSEFGMILDGGMDFVVANFIGVGFGIATLPFIDLSYDLWLLISIFPSMFLHVALYDHLKKRFLLLVDESPQQASLTSEEANNLVIRIFDGLYNIFYINITNFVMGTRKGEPRPDVTAEQARDAMRRPMHMASWLGLGTHFMLLYGAAMVGFIAPAVTFWAAFYSVVVGINVWLVFTIIAWRRGEAKLRTVARGQE